MRTVMLQQTLPQLFARPHHQAETPHTRIVQVDYESGYWITRFLFQRAVGVIYLAAFAVVVNQFLALCGEQGLLPARRFLERVPFRQVPTLFKFCSSNSFMYLMAWAGMILSLLAASGLSDAFGIWVSILVWFLLWLIYLSFVNAGQTFYAFGWESLLLETGFLAIFLGSSDTEPPAVLVWLIRWLLFRLMFGAGLIKIRGDRCWRDLTCMKYHYETQPQPNPLSWYFHRSPAWMHKAAVLFNHLVELVVPFAYFIPGVPAYMAGATTIMFQALLIISSNFSWLNYLSICLCIACFDDRILSLFPIIPPDHLNRYVAHQAACYTYAALVVVLSIKPTLNLVSPAQVMNTSYDPLHLVNTYGAFGSITKVRREIVIEGTDDRALHPDATWLEYEFKGKPGDVKKRPPLISPYHYRLDWQMWFAAMSVYFYHPWFVNLLHKLLENNKQVLGLLAKNPFPDKSPAHIRAILYEYRFTSRAERSKSGAIWKRRQIGVYFPGVNLDLMNEAQEQAYDFM